MASKLFRELAAQSQDTKKLDSILSGGTWLGEGKYDVVIQAVDTTKIDTNNYVVFTFDADGKTKNDNVFLYNREQTDWGRGVRNLWAALIPNPEALKLFLVELEKDEKAFEMFTGMKLAVELKYGKGFRISSTETGFVCVDETGQQVGDAAETVEEAKENAEAAGGTRAYINVTNMKATNAEANIAALNKAIANKAKAPTSVFSVGKTI